jgi:hypothetical protein
MNKKINLCFLLLNKEQGVQVSDTTKVDSSNESQAQKNI